MNQKKPSNVSIIGCGRVGQKLARIFLEQGVAVSGLVRSKQSKQTLAEIRVKPLPGNLDWAEFEIEDRSIGSALYWFAPPPSAGVIDTRIQVFLAQLTTTPQRIILISTSGVYGDHGGAWVDESSECRPGSDRARRRFDAEQRCIHWCNNHGVGYVILRVASIYGPDILPVARLNRGDAVLIQKDSPWSNRIHVDDLVAICHAAASRGEDNQIYNVCDDQPGTMTQYFNVVADHLGLARPPQIDLATAQQTLSAGMLSYLAESRRLRNDKVLQRLDITLQYPNLQAGLLAMCQE